jgi:hypothetical protein
MAYQLKSYRTQGNGVVIPEATGGFGSIDEARTAGERALSAREELQYSEVVDEVSGAIVGVVKR